MNVIPSPIMIFLSGLSPAYAQEIDQAIQAHMNGNREQAQQICQQVLAYEQSHSDALHLLGLMAYEVQQYSEAQKWIEQAILGIPYSAELYNNLGVILLVQSQFDKAQEILLRAVSMAPKMAEIYNNLGLVQHKQKHLPEAIRYLEEALFLQPDLPESYNNLAMIKQEQGHLAEAIELYKKALTFSFSYAEAYNNLAIALHLQGKWQQAQEVFQQALTFQPAYPEIVFNLGQLLAEHKNYPDALGYYQNALRLKPNDPAVYYALGILYQHLGAFSQAYQCYQKSLRLDLTDAVRVGHIYRRLAEIYYLRAQFPEALRYFQTAMSLSPDSAVIHSNYLLCLFLLPELTPAELLTQLRQWEIRHGRVEALAPQPVRAAIGSSRLKIGYISPDFCHHSTADTFSALFQRHDRSQFEIFAYSYVPQPDLKTTEFQQQVDHWRDITHLTDLDVARQIQADGIDILLDLAGHTPNSRLRIFCYRPAPVQATGLGFCHTTGLRCMDYLLADRWVMPPELTPFISEEVYYLTVFRPWHPPQEPLELQPPPYLTQGHITFGSVSGLFRMNEVVIRTWADILHRVSESRLFLKGLGFDDAATVQLFQARFNHYGISAERITFVGKSTHQQHLESYHHIDLVLDSFPSNGGVNTFETLWMGVPMITLATGNRTGSSILNHLGLAEWVAQTPEDYVTLAVSLAQQPERWLPLKQELQPRLLASPFLDPQRFTQDVEQAYRYMWEQRKR